MASPFKPSATTVRQVVSGSRMANGRRYSRDGGALEARGVPAAGGRLRADAVGEIELDSRVLVVKRIHVTYHLAVDEAVIADQAKRAAIDRVLGVHADRCPVARTIGGCVDITTSLELTT